MYSAVGLVSDVLVSLLAAGLTPDDLVGSQTADMVLRCLVDLEVVLKCLVVLEVVLRCLVDLGVTKNNWMSPSIYTCLYGEGVNKVYRLPEYVIKGACMCKHELMTSV